MLLGVFCVTSWGALGVVYQVTVRTARGRLFADASLRGALLSDPHSGDLVNRVLDLVSIAFLLGAIAVIAVVALVRMRREAGLAAISLIVVANVSAQLLKTYVLERPDLGLSEVAPATLNSLPSGHSTAAFSVLVALMFVVQHRPRVAVAALGVVYASLTALATMAAGWHRAADSVAAFLLVGGWAAVAGIVVVLLTEPPPARPADAASRRRMLLSAGGAAGCLVLGLTLLTALAYAGPLRESRLGPATAFFTGGLIIVGTASAILVTLLALVERVVPSTPRLTTEESTA